MLRRPVVYHGTVSLLCWVKEESTRGDEAYTEADCTHGHHGQDVQPSDLQPLSKPRTRGHAIRSRLGCPAAVATKPPSSLCRRRRRVVSRRGGPRWRASSVAKESHGCRLWTVLVLLLLLALALALVFV